MGLQTASERRRIRDRRLLPLAAIVAIALVASGGGVARAAARTSVASPATRAQTVTLYAVPSALQYDDFSDDRARGEGHNPFGNYKTAFTPPPTSELSYGPFVGDEAFIDYNVYSDSSLKSSAGTAIYVCEYGFDKISYCGATYQLNGGTLVGFGSFGFNATTISLPVTGGSGTYRGAQGTLTVTASAAARANATPFLANPPGVDAETAQLRFALRLPSNPTSHATSSYAFPTEQQFLDHNDDEARGDVNNPFGPRVYKQCLALPHPQEVTCSATLTKRAEAATEEHNNGPFAGDQVVFAFKLYGNAKRSSTTGSAVLSCQYSFNHNGLCDETFTLKGGTLTAVGIVNFDAKSFTMSVTGGDGTYSGTTGDVAESSASNGLQHLAFTLLG